MTNLKLNNISVVLNESTSRGLYSLKSRLNLLREIQEYLALIKSNIGDFESLKLGLNRTVSYVFDGCDDDFWLQFLNLGGDVSMVSDF